MSPLGGRSSSNNTEEEAQPVLQTPEDVESQSSQPASRGGGGRRLRRGRRQQYQSVSNTDDDDDDQYDGTDNFHDEGEENIPEKSQLSQPSSSSQSQPPSLQAEEVTTTDELENNPNKLTFIILDPAQKRFEVTALSTMTVGELKKRGHKVHKVAPQSQRLIYHGKLLADPQTLHDVGLTSSGIIIHLFPKPRVVIQNSSEAPGSSTCSINSSNQNEQENNNQNTGGAHIPQIVLDPYEAEQRATILVLGSADFIEAQNNVKLLSFFLLVVSGIELFNLFLILMGVPQQQSQNNSNYNDYYYHTTEDDVNDFLR